VFEKDMEMLEWGGYRKGVMAIAEVCILALILLEQLCVSRQIHRRAVPKRL
jgi:hypothetical protein